MLHVVSLPHTSVSRRYNTCAYTAKVYKFAKMFPDALIYSNEGSTVPFVQIFSHKDVFAYFRNYDWWQKGEVYKVDYNPELPYWKEFNRRVIERIRERIQPHDIICLIGGWSQKDVADAFPAHIVTEFGVGYEGIFTKYRVFESYAWMHHVYGLKNMKDGSYFDRVIPNYFDPSEFPFRKKKEDYLLFASRPISRKGIEVVREIAKRGHKVKTIGKEKLEGENIEWLGYADSKMRGEVMSKAKALLCPTVYIEPFGGVTVEANLCGTPVITSDWGAFPETVEQGVSGFRCRMLSEFLEATQKVSTLNSRVLKNRALRLYSLDNVKPQYEKYFAQLETLWGKGWYES
jgi:glycosyltransferase involved in cell wall biosynthesis